MICNIVCKSFSYKATNDNKWVFNSKNTDIVDSIVIDNMVASSNYISSLGEYMNISYVKNRRFGLVVSKIVTISTCKTIKTIYFFEYKQAQVSI